MRPFFVSVHGHKEIRQRTHFLKIMYKELSAPLHVQWEITSACPKRCFYCANYWRHDNEKLLTQPAKAAHGKIDLLIDQLIKENVFSVTITGGEPLLVLEYYAEKLMRLRSHGITMSLNSTLSCLTPKLIDHLIELDIKNILVSVPSYDPKIDALITNSPTSWQNTADGIKMALAAGLMIEANMVVCKHNVGHVFATAEYVKRLGVQAFAASKMAHPGSIRSMLDLMLTPADFQIMLSELKRAHDILGIRIDTVQAYPFCSFMDHSLRNQVPAYQKLCAAAKTFCMIAPNGDIRPCAIASDAYGNISDSGGLATAWKAMRHWRDDSLIPDNCRVCKHKMSCGGGCRADAKNAHGLYDSPDPYCDINNIPEIFPQRKQEIEMTGNYRLHPHVRLRAESFGGIIYVNGAHWCAVDETIYEMFKHKHEVYARNDFEAKLNVSPQEANRTMNHLFNKGVFVPQRKGGDNNEHQRHN